MPLNFVYTMVQKSKKWPKTQIKGGSCLNITDYHIANVLKACVTVWHTVSKRLRDEKFSETAFPRQRRLGVLTKNDELFSPESKHSQILADWEEHQGAETLSSQWRRNSCHWTEKNTHHRPRQRRRPTHTAVRRSPFATAARTTWACWMQLSCDDDDADPSPMHSN